MKKFLVSNRIKFSSSRIKLQLVLSLTILFSASIYAQSTTPARDGKLLHGDKWLPFSYPAKADFYVSTNGNDSWSGTLSEPNSTKNDGPFLTIKRAQKAVRDLKSKVFFPKGKPIEKRWIGSPHPLGRGKDILVYIREGHYNLTQRLVFEPADGGERVETNLPTGAFEYHKLKDHYVTYAAYPGEKPVITGERPITNWTQKGKVWSAHFEADSVAMLIANGKKQVLARTPNQGYFVPPAISKNTEELYFKKGDLLPWKDLTGNRVVMLLRWHTGINSFVKIDTKTGVASLKAPQEGVVIVPPRFYVENVKSLMDAPSEWFFDKKLKEISYLPTSNIANPNTAQVGAPMINQLVEVRGELDKPVRNLRIYGLTFEGAITGKNISKGNYDGVDGSTGVLETSNVSSSAISYEYAHACEFVDGEVRSCLGTGITIKRGCYQTQILRSRFETLDDGGIYATGAARPGDSRDIVRETYIQYNKLYDCGGVNILANNTLMTNISHNYLTKTRGRYGIDVGGWSNLEEAIDGGYVVEYNHLDDVQRDADDSGAIKTAGLTFNSVIRKNLVHDVRAGFFNDNVGFWFDNMSSRWVSEENIYYNLEQGEMKLCAAMIEDNTYQRNFKIEPPLNAPEIIIDGDPKFQISDLKIDASLVTKSGAIEAGSIVRVSATVSNSGSTGSSPIEFYLDGKIYQQKLFPVIRNNQRKIDFEIRIYDAGEHKVAIGSSPYQTVKVEGDKPTVVFENFILSEDRALNGEVLKATATAKNLTGKVQTINARLFIDQKNTQNQPLELKENESKEVSFMLSSSIGNHKVRIENSTEKTVQIFESRALDLSKEKLLQYCSAKAKPSEISADGATNKYKITASGSDFYHAEDSYGAVYLKGVKGDFVATVKITGFSDRTHEWFRSGLFARNDISQSFDVQPGSKGSVLVFGTPGRAGIQYDEFANGCMHKASSQNLPENSKMPLYLKMVRHGDHFSGYISLDGQNWIIERHTQDIPELHSSIDLGLAAGGPDKRQYTVEFAEWKIEVAK